MTDPASSPAATPVALAEGLVPGRTCNSCTLCCKVFRIPELDKAAGQWCRHVVQGGGCAIHQDRPDVCRTFFCHFLRNPHLGPEWRPDTARFLLYTEMGGRRMVAVTDPGAPRAWRKAPYYGQLKRWAALGLNRGHQVLVFSGRACTAVLPDRDETLGNVGVGDEVIYEPAAGGRVAVTLRRRAGAA